MLDERERRVPRELAASGLPPIHELTPGRGAATRASRWSSCYGEGPAHGARRRAGRSRSPTATRIALRLLVPHETARRRDRLLPRRRLGRSARWISSTRWRACWRSEPTCARRAGRLPARARASVPDRRATTPGRRLEWVAANVEQIAGASRPADRRRRQRGRKPRRGRRAAGARGRDRRSRSRCSSTRSPTATSTPRPTLSPRTS